MSTSQALTHHVLSRIHELEPITEVGTPGEPFHRLTKPESGEVIGNIRLFKGEAILDTVAYVELHVAEVGMTAYMLMAFAQPGSLYPHLAFDCELQAEDSAFHIDLVHKREFTTDIPFHCQRLLERVSREKPLSLAFPH